MYPVGSRSARGVTVQITDPSGKAVEGAVVSFLLPDHGPSGVFATGARTEIATTRADGMASAWGMRWNHSPGPLEIRITAAKAGLRASAVCSVALTNIESTPPAVSGKVSRGSRKWLWITLAVAGGAAGGLAAGGLGGKSSGAAASPAVTTTIGAPTIAIGRP